MTASAATRPRHRGYYFFLSYAHSATTLELTGYDADPSVARFYTALSEQVAQHASARGRLKPGFFDQLISGRSDLKSELTDALGHAEVFVPLYSPQYFATSWPVRELEVFQGRLEQAGSQAGGNNHLMPVLWTPFPSWQQRPAAVAPALELGADVPEYAENGMRALCMLAAYREAYDVVLGRLARSIVTVAEQSPIGVSAAPDIDDVPGRTTESAAFTVAFLMPATSPLLTLGPDDARPSFGERNAPPLARNAVALAERLGFRTRVVIPAVSRELARSPGLVLVDPLLLQDPGEAARLDLFKDLPPWVLPLVLAVDQSPDGGRQAGAVVRALRDFGRTTVDVVENLEDFRSVIPRLVYRARRAYLRAADAVPTGGKSEHD